MLWFRIQKVFIFYFWAKTFSSSLLYYFYEGRIKVLCRCVRSEALCVECSNMFVILGYVLVYVILESVLLCNYGKCLRLSDSSRMLYVIRSVITNF